MHADPSEFELLVASIRESLATRPGDWEVELLLTDSHGGPAVGWALIMRDRLYQVRFGVQARRRFNPFP